jgi:ribose transport system permease protein
MRTAGRGFSFGFDRFSGLYLWAFFIVVFGIWTPRLFLTQSTVHSIASQQAVAGILALAVLVPLVAGAYDLSVGASINLCAILASLLQSQDHWPLAAAIAVAIAVGALTGLVNGFIVVKLRVNSFIATLGTMSVIAAVQVMVTNNTQPFPATGKVWTNLTQWQLGGFQVIVFYLLVLALVVWWLLEHTPAGRYLHAVGGNADAARLSGISTGKWTLWSLVTSGLICGIDGVLYASQSGASLTFGATLLLPAFAAAFLGMTGDAKWLLPLSCLPYRKKR